MIRLAERNIFILNDQGEQEPFCLDDLRNLLKTCLRESVIQDDFLIEDILYALDLFLNKAGSESKQPLRMTDIHALLEKVLCDNGFADAATLLRLDSGRTEIDAEKRLLKIVSEFDAADQEKPQLLRFVRSRLSAATYDLQQLSERFLREFVREEWRLMRARASSCAIDGGFALPRLSLRDLIALEETRADWDWTQAHLLGGGYLFPSIQVHIKLQRILAGMDFPAYSEILLSENLQKLCSRLQAALQRAFDHSQDNLGEQVKYLSIHIEDLSAAASACTSTADGLALKKMVKDFIENFFQDNFSQKCPVKYKFV